MVSEKVLCSITVTPVTLWPSKTSVVDSEDDVPKNSLPSGSSPVPSPSKYVFSALYKRRINSGAVIILAVFYLIRRCGSICIACRCGCVIINACCRTSYQRQQHKCARNIALTAVFIILFSFLGGQCLVWHRAACQCLFNGG